MRELSFEQMRHFYWMEMAWIDGSRAGKVGGFLESHSKKAASPWTYARSNVLLSFLCEVAKPECKMEITHRSLGNIISFMACDSGLSICVTWGVTFKMCIKLFSTKSFFVFRSYWWPVWKTSNLKILLHWLAIITSAVDAGGNCKLSVIFIKIKLSWIKPFY